MLDITIFKAVGHDLLPTMKVPKNMSSKESSWRRDRLSFIVRFLGNTTQDKLVVQHHKFKIVLFAVFKMFGHPQGPDQNTGLVFFRWHLEKLRFFSECPLFDLSFAQCYLSKGKLFILSNYVVAPDTTLFPQCLPFSVIMRQKGEWHFSGKSWEIRIHRSVLHSDPKASEGARPSSCPCVCLVRSPERNPANASFCISFQTREGFHYIFNLKPQHSKLIISEWKGKDLKASVNWNN